MTSYNKRRSKSRIITDVASVYYDDTEKAKTKAILQKKRGERTQETEIKKSPPKKKIVSKPRKQYKPKTKKSGTFNKKIKQPERKGKFSKSSSPKRYRKQRFRRQTGKKSVQKKNITVSRYNM